MSKRRKGFPSETHVKRGVRRVHSDKLLEEKLGRNDLCPCGSGKRFKQCCLRSGRFRWRAPQRLLSENEPVTGSFRTAPCIEYGYGPYLFIRIN
jgi:hypothetical protein